VTLDLTSWSIETARLRITPWRTGATGDPVRGRLVRDLAPVLTARVLQHLPPPLQDTSDLDRWIEGRAAESDVFCVRYRETDALAGLLILVSFTEDTPVLHLGYLLGEAHWGQGLATEILQGLVAHCRQQPEQLQIVGGVAHGNVASARVLEKVGFFRDAASEEPGMDIFRLKA